MAEDLELDDFDLDAELAAMKNDQEAEETEKKRIEQGTQEPQEQEPQEESDGDAPAAPVEPEAAPASRAQSAAAPKSPSSRPGTSAKVHPAPEPPPLRSDGDPEKGAAPEPDLDDTTPDWADKWLSSHNKTAKLNAFQQYIDRVQDQGEGPVTCPSAEERHATASWMTSRFLLDRFSAHGVPHIVRHTSRCRRFFWTLVVLAALAVLVFEAWVVLAEFLTYPKKVTFEILEDKEPEFPSVTICNFNILSTDKMKEVKQYQDIVRLEEELTNQKLDCDAYKKDFEGYYSTNDDYEYDYMWMNEDEMEPENSPGTGSPEMTTPSTEQTGGTDSTDGIEPTFYEVSTKSAVTGDDSTVSTGSPGSTDPTEKAGEKVTTEPAADNTERRRKREVEPSRSKSPAQKKNTSGTVRLRDSSGRSAGVGRGGGGTPDGRQREGPDRETDPGGRRLQSIAEPAGAAAAPGSTGRRRLVRVRRRRSAAAGEDDSSSQDEPKEDGYKVIAEDFGSSNKSFSFFDPICKCEMTCTDSGCYQKDSIFDQLGEGRTYRDLLLLMRASTVDPATLQRAFTPSVEDIQKYGIKSAQFITSCSLDNAKCSHADFQQWQSDGYGNCFTFNSGFRYAKRNNEWVHVKPNKTRTYGSKSGLRVTLNVDPSQYASLLTPDVGVRVLVHPADQLPLPEERGFSVVPGFTTTVGISRKRIHRVGQPHGNCREHGESVDGRQIRYTTTACQKRCVENAIRTECHCMESLNRYLAMGLVRGLDRCNPLVNVTADRCRQMVKSRFSSGKSSCDCPPACHEDRFDKSLSMNLPNKNYYKIMRNFNDDFAGADLCESGEISNSTIRLQVYLEDLSYEYIHESPAYSLVSLVSNIGGLMGLCLGLSALTLVEFFEYLLELVANGWRNCRNRKERAATRSGIKKIEVLPADPKTGMQCVTIIHTFERPPPHVVELPPPPKPPQAECEVQTKVSLTFLGKKKKPSKKAGTKKAPRRR